MIRPRTFLRFSRNVGGHIQGFAEELLCSCNSCSFVLLWRLLDAGSHGESAARSCVLKPLVGPESIWRRLCSSFVILTCFLIIIIRISIIRYPKKKLHMSKRVPECRELQLEQNAAFAIQPPGPKCTTTPGVHTLADCGRPRVPVL